MHRVSKNTTVSGTKVGRNKKSPILFHLAASQRKIQKVRSLIEGGADVNVEDNAECAPLHYAALRGHEECVTALSRAKGVDVNAKNNSGFTPVHLAALDGHTFCVLGLMKQGADINLKDIEGSTPLHVALQEGHEICARTLIDAGADINAEDNKGFTPLYYNQLKKNAKKDAACEEALIFSEKSEDLDRFHIDASSRSTQSIKASTQENSNICIEHEDPTPLQSAALEGDIKTLEFLIRNGDDVNATDESGYTLLHLAAREGHDTCITILSETYDAKVDEETDLGLTPLHIAASYGHILCMSSLITHGANVNRKDNLGFTPLHYAQSQGHTACVNLLTKHLSSDEKSEEVSSIPVTGSFAQAEKKRKRENSSSISR